jgi:Uma2 family endonuclease
MSTVQDQLTLGPEMAGTLMTPEEFDSAPDGDELYVYELIHGVLIVTPPPSEGERGPNELLGNLLFLYRREHPQGAALDYTLTEHTLCASENRRRADRVIWVGLGRVPDVRRELPAIVVEFVSAGRRNRQRDYHAKRDEYREAGIAEYWIIDRFRRQLTVFRQVAAAEPVSVVREGEVYATPLLPGFELPLAQLFAESDRLEQARQDDAAADPRLP